MASETLSFSITGDSSSASKAFKDTAAGAGLASAAAKELNDRLATQSKTAQVSAGATLAMVRADQLLADAEAELSGAAAKARLELAAQGRAAEDAAAKTKLAADAAKSAAGGGGLGFAGNAIAAGIVTGVATAPALLAGGAVIAGVLGGGIAAYASSPQLQAAGKSLVSGLEKEVEAAAQPLVAPIGAAISQLGGYARGLGPELKSAFADVAPDVLPLTKGLESLVSGVLPGLLSLLKNGQPAMAAFSTVLGDLGTGTGQLLTSLSGDLGPASRELSDVGTVLKSVLGAAGPLISAAATDAKPLADAIAATATGAGRLISAMPPAALDAIVGGIGGIYLATKAWGVAQGAITALTGSGFLTGAISGIKDFTLATEGASFAERGLLAAELALNAINPVAWAAAAVAGIAVVTYEMVRLASQTQSLAPAVDTYTAALAKNSGVTGYNISGYQALIGKEQALEQQSLASAHAAEQAGQGGKAFGDAIAGVLAGGALQKLQQQVGSMTGNLGTIEGHFGITQTAAEQLASAAGVTAGQLGKSGAAGKDAAGKVIIYGDAIARANDPTSALAGDVATLDNNLLAATTQLNAFNDLWGVLVGNSLSSQAAVLADAQAFDTLQKDITKNGAGSVTAKAAFVSYMQQVGSSLSTLVQNKASVGDVNSAYSTSIKNLKSLHDLTPAQRQDIQGLTKDYNLWANTTVGLGKDTLTAAHAITGDWTAGLDSTAQKSPAVTRDIGALSDAVLKTGTQSSATAGDRAQLIKDLEAAGVQAQTAGSLVDGLIGTLGNVPKSTVANVVVHASGTGGVTETSTLPGMSQTTAHMVLGGLSSGGKLPGYGGGDRRLYLLEDGEAVVDKDRTRKYAGVLGAMGVPGMSAGGLVTAAGSGEAGFAAGWEGAFAKGAVSALSAASAAASASSGALALSGLSASSGMQAFAAIAALRGWGPALLQDWVNVEMREAGFSLTATNPVSGAYGMAQFINGAGEYAQWGGNSTTYLGEAVAMANYMQARYGGPAGAWAHEQAHSWYGGGLDAVISKPTVIGVGERGPEHVQVTPVTAGRGGGAGTMNLTVNISAPVGSKAELKNWLQASVDELARDGKLSWAFRQSPSAKP